MPELILQHGDDLLIYEGVTEDQYDEVRHRLTRLRADNANWFCTKAEVAWQDGTLVVKYSLNKDTTVDVVKHVIARAFVDINFLKGNENDHRTA